MPGVDWETRATIFKSWSKEGKILVTEVDISNNGLPGFPVEETILEQIYYDTEEHISAVRRNIRRPFLFMLVS